MVDLGQGEAQMKVLGLGLLVCLSILLFDSSAAWANHEPIERFYGHYKGHVNLLADGKEMERDLSVSIKPQEGHSFNITWTTVTTKSSGKTKAKTYSIDFVPTHRANIYSSAMKTNVFGGRVAMDPLKGDPYVWARIAGKTLTVYALLITDAGGYEMQVYERALIERGLHLKFSRILDGKTLKFIEADLTRSNH
jgi:hypothetical protein